MIKKFKDVYKCDSITVNLTDSCNLNCRYCFEHCKNSSFMTPQVGIDVIDAAYRQLDVRTKGSKFMLNFFGGEPFLNWKTMKAVIDHCNKKDYQILFGVTTNLTILDEEIIQYIDDNSIHLLVSADGIKSVHDKNRSDSYDLVMKNLQTLIDRELGIFVEIRMTLMPDEIDKAFESVKMFLDMGFDNICPMPVTDVEWDKESLIKLEKFYSDLMELYTSLLNDTTQHRNYSIKNTDEILTNVLEPEVPIPYMCPIGSTRWCAFDTNGDVYPCHQIPTSKDATKEEQCIGNVYTGVDESKILKQKRKAKYLKPECSSCTAKAVCASGCPQENLRETGDIFTASDSYCNVKIAMVNAVKKYQKKILTAKNIRSRMLNILKENLKIKDYIDKELVEKQFRCDLEANIKLMHISEMIRNLGEEKILPSFGDYFNDKIIEVSAKYLSKVGVKIPIKPKNPKEV